MYSCDSNNAQLEVTQCELSSQTTNIHFVLDQFVTKCAKPDSQNSVILCPNIFLWQIAFCAWLVSAETLWVTHPRITNTLSGHDFRGKHWVENCYSYCMCTNQINIPCFFVVQWSKWWFRSIIGSQYQSYRYHVRADKMRHNIYVWNKRFT